MAVHGTWTSLSLKETQSSTYAAAEEKLWLIAIEVRSYVSGHRILGSRSPVSTGIVLDEVKERLSILSGG